MMQLQLADSLNKLCLSLYYMPTSSYLYRDPLFTVHQLGRYHNEPLTP